MLVMTPTTTTTTTPSLLFMSVLFATTSSLPASASIRRITPAAMTTIVTSGFCRYSCESSNWGRRYTTTKSDSWHFCSRQTQGPRRKGPTSIQRLFGSSSKSRQHPADSPTVDDTEFGDSASAPFTARQQQQPFATRYHAPVMWKECIDALLACDRAQERQQRKQERERGCCTNEITTDQHDEQQQEEEQQSPLVFIDGTTGGGGHSLALLQRLRPGDVVYGCDVDPAALETASERLRAYIDSDENENDNKEDALPRFVPVQSNFCDLAADDRLSHLANNVDGILLDLGVSSHQIDTPERGFAYLKDGPLDMRMSSIDGDNSGGLTAADICNEFDADEIQRILSVHGDEDRRRAKSIAHAILRYRPLATTTDLYNAVASVTPAYSKRSKRAGRTATLSRVFQSLRIVVNREDESLRRALLEMAPALLRKPGGRLVVLSYHSAEDRAAKRAMRDGTAVDEAKVVEKDVYGNTLGPPPPFKPVGKPLKASPEEVRVNARARSATLRVARRQ